MNRTLAYKFSLKCTILIICPQNKRKIQEEIGQKRLEIDREKLKLQHVKVGLSIFPLFICKSDNISITMSWMWISFYVFYRKGPWEICGSRMGWTVIIHRKHRKLLMMHNKPKSLRATYIGKMCCYILKASLMLYNCFFLPFEFFHYHGRSSMMSF